MNVYRDNVKKLINKTKDYFQIKENKAKKNKKKDEITVEEEKFINELQEISNEFRKGMISTEKNVKRSIRLTESANKKLKKIQQFLTEEYSSSEFLDNKINHKKEISLTDTIDFLINQFYIFQMSQYKLDKLKDKNKNVDFDKWVGQNISKKEQEEKSQPPENDSEANKKIDKDLSIIKNQLSKLYILELNSYFEDHPFIHDGDFIKNGTLGNFQSQISKIDQEVKKVKKQQFIDDKKVDLYKGDK